MLKKLLLLAALTSSFSLCKPAVSQSVVDKKIAELEKRIEALEKAAQPKPELKKSTCSEACKCGPGCTCPHPCKC